MALFWDDVQHEFEFDGAWRDVYVLDTDVSDWQRVLDVVTTKYPTTCLREGVPIAIPLATDLFLPDRLTALLKLNIAGLDVNCHFFTQTEIEFDLDPRDITGQRQLDAILEFLRLLADATHQPALLCDENLVDRPIFRVAPGSNEVEYFPA